MTGTPKTTITFKLTFKNALQFSHLDDPNPRQLGEVSGITVSLGKSLGFEMGAQGAESPV